jgi:hypothetical protein
LFGTQYYQQKNCSMRPGFRIAMLRSRASTVDLGPQTANPVDFDGTTHPRINTSKMITYADGTEMKIGDSVLIEHDKTPAVITLIIESADDQKECNVKEPGVMLQSPSIGLAFLPVALFSTDPIAFVSRGKSRTLNLR